MKNGMTGGSREFSADEKSEDFFFFFTQAFFFFCKFPPCYTSLNILILFKFEEATVNFLLVKSGC